VTDETGTQQENELSDVIETESGKEVRMPYRRGCREYTIGFATAFLMATTVLGYVLLWKQHVPKSLYYTSVIFFVVFSLSGFAIIGVAYTRPVWFYELMEEIDQ
jgi:hypothetical protein